jgi:hypothetical protein
VPVCENESALNLFAIQSGLARSSQSALLPCGSRLHARSDNEVFDYLVTVGTNQRDDLEQLVYSLFGNLRTVWPGGSRAWRRSASFILP